MTHQTEYAGRGGDVALTDYVEELNAALSGLAATDRSGAKMIPSDAVRAVQSDIRTAHEAGGHLYFIGNGGSAAIASHLANDFVKNAGMRASALNDPAFLTCFSNDYGYADVYSEQLRRLARPGDFLLAISSSGASPNILNAARFAADHGLRCTTFCGFADDAPLRSLGDVNFYVPNAAYGLVELSHMILGHALLDLMAKYRNGFLR